MLNFFGNQDCREESKSSCTWIILIVIFLFCCGGDCFGNKKCMLSFNPCTIAIIAALLACCGCLNFRCERERCC